MYDSQKFVESQTDSMQALRAFRKEMAKAFCKGLRRGNQLGGIAIAQAAAARAATQAAAGMVSGTSGHQNQAEESETQEVRSLTTATIRTQRGRGRTRGRSRKQTGAKKMRRETKQAGGAARDSGDPGNVGKRAQVVRVLDQSRQIRPTPPQAIVTEQSSLPTQTPTLQIPLPPVSSGQNVYPTMPQVALPSQYPGVGIGGNDQIAAAAMFWNPLKFGRAQAGSSYVQTPAAPQHVASSAFNAGARPFGIGSASQTCPGLPDQSSGSALHEATIIQLASDHADREVEELLATHQDVEEERPRLGQGRISTGNASANGGSGLNLRGDGGDAVKKRS